MWVENGCTTLRYEDFVDDISILAWVIAGMMEKTVEQDVIDAITTIYSFEQNKKKSEEIGKVHADMLFPGHLQTGEVGRWKRMLTISQASRIRRDIGGAWFQKWGYAELGGIDEYYLVG